MFLKYRATALDLKVAPYETKFEASPVNRGVSVPGPKSAAHPVIPVETGIQASPFTVDGFPISREWRFDQW